MPRPKRTSATKSTVPQANAGSTTVSPPAGIISDSSEAESLYEILAETSTSNPAPVSSAAPTIARNSSPPTPVVTSHLRSLNILMVIDQLNIGGTETYTLSLTRELLRQGAKVVIAGKKGKLLHSLIGLGCTVYELDFVTNYFEANLEHYSELLRLLSSIIETEDIHIVHAHQFPSGKVARKAAEDKHVPFVFTVHGTYYENMLLDEIRNAHVISVSPAVERMLQSNGISSETIPNGVDITEYQGCNIDYREHLRHKMGISQKAQVLLYAGRLSWEKADICKEIIHATAHLRKHSYPRLHLIIVGGGREEEELMTLANQKQISNGQQFITFAGESVNMRSYYAVSDCVLGTGRTALEAMASMRPVIAIGSRGFLGAVQFANSSKAWDSWFGDHGTTPEPLSREMLIEQIDCILSMSADDRANLSRWGRNHVVDRYPIATVAKKMLDAYEHAVYTKIGNYSM